MDEGIVLHIWGILLETICAGETRVAAPVIPAELLASVVAREIIAKHADCCVSLSVIPQGARSVRIPARRAAAEPHCASDGPVADTVGSQLPRMWSGLKVSAGGLVSERILKLPGYA